MVFCNSSKAAYGCVIYEFQEDQSSLLFSNEKVAPIDKSTLPPFELLSVFLAFQCVPSIINDKNFYIVLALN